MIAFTIKIQAKINYTNHGFGQGKLSNYLNIIEIEHLFPFIATKGNDSLSRGFLIALSGILCLFQCPFKDSAQSPDPVTWADGFLLVFSLTDSASWSMAQDLVSKLRRSRDDERLPGKILKVRKLGISP